MGEFADKIFEVVRQIPCGNVATYGLVAQVMGRPQSARYVGFALRANPSPGQDVDDIPCHRVVFANGSICDNFAFGCPEVQRRLLEAEGVSFVDNMHVNLAKHLWTGEGFGATSPDTPSAPPADFDWEAELDES